VIIRTQKDNEVKHWKKSHASQQKVCDRLEEDVNVLERDLVVSTDRQSSVYWIRTPCNRVADLDKEGRRVLPPERCQRYDGGHFTGEDRHR
jgi:hypothetical protein